MIVREYENEFVMIEQDDHATISGEIISAWKNQLFSGQEFRNSVEYAIYNHDYAWKQLDKHPFWNDKANAPYTFIDFPVLPKTVFYKHGIDEVDKNDAYAGLLCSKHYTRFLLNDTTKEAQAFVQQEEERWEHTIRTLPEFSKNLVDFHYGLLQFCDNLSLYMCLNSPGVSKGEEHPFFKNGIPTTNMYNIFSWGKIELKWINKNTITMNEFPFSEPVNIKIKQKTVNKHSILERGLAESYQEAPFQYVNIALTKE